MKPHLPLITLAIFSWMLVQSPDDSARADSSKRPNFSGDWVLNAEVSDDPGEKAREAMRNRQGKSGGPSGGFGGPGGGGGGVSGGFGGGGRNGGGRSSGPPRGREGQNNPQDFNRGMENLTIEHEDPGFELTFDKRDPEVFEIDGKNVEVIRGGEVQDVRVKWKRKGRIEVRRKVERATRWEIYALGAGGEQLYVTVNVQPGRGGGFTFRRVYDRVVKLTVGDQSESN